MTNIEIPGSLQPPVELLDSTSRELSGLIHSGENDARQIGRAAVVRSQLEGIRQELIDDILDSDLADPLLNAALIEAAKNPGDETFQESAESVYDRLVQLHSLFSKEGEFMARVDFDQVAIGKTNGEGINSIKQVKNSEDLYPLQTATVGMRRFLELNLNDHGVYDSLKISDLEIPIYRLWNPLTNGDRIADEYERYGTVPPSCLLFGEEAVASYWHGLRMQADGQGNEEMHTKLARFESATTHLQKLDNYQRKINAG